MYLPGDINGLHLLAAEIFAGNTTVRNELVNVLDALLRLEQLTRKEYADITARLAAAYGLLKTHGLVLCILEGSVSVIQNSGMFVLG